jgi:hypothetical protein
VFSPPPVIRERTSTAKIGNRQTAVASQNGRQHHKGNLIGIFCRRFVVFAFPTVQWSAGIAPTGRQLLRLRGEYTLTIEPARADAAEVLQLERQLGELVNEAYGLTGKKLHCSGKLRRPGCPAHRPLQRITAISRTLLPLQFARVTGRTCIRIWPVHG